jgi:hypothetical protein
MRGEEGGGLENSNKLVPSTRAKFMERKKSGNGYWK